MNFDRIQVYCPVIKATLKISSELIDDVGQFTKYILWAISQSYSTEDIEQVIELDAYVIREEALYLMQIGFLVQNENGYSIGINGQEFLNLMTAITAANDSNIEVLINCYSGEIINFSDKTISVEELGEKQKFPDITAKQLFYNKNYSNSKEYLLENYCGLLSSLSEKQLESLYVEVNSERQVNYLSMGLSHIPTIREKLNTNANESTLVFIERAVEFVKIRFCDERLSNFRNVLETLALLDKFDKTLLSAKSAELLCFNAAEKSVNSNVPLLKFDTYFNEVFVENICDDYDKNRHPKIKLASEHSIAHTGADGLCKLLEIDEEIYTLQFLEVTSKPHLKLIPFSFFKIEEGEQ